MTRHMTPAELAERWRRPVAWVRSQAKAGTIPGLRIGGAWRFDPTDIEMFEARHKTADPLTVTALSAARQKSA